MVIIFILLVQAIQAGTYNILSLDSASYYGLMTAEFVSYLEKKAYMIARRDFCIEERLD